MGFWLRRESSEAPGPTQVHAASTITSMLQGGRLSLAKLPALLRRYPLESSAFAFRTGTFAASSALACLLRRLRLKEQHALSESQ